jgi:transcriptional regulator with XRE-family HTH domain
MKETIPSVPPLTLGWRLRMSLERSEASQQEMADLVEAHRTTLTRWMHDEIIPKRLYLRIWAEHTGVPYQWFEEVLPDTPPVAEPAPHKSRRRRRPPTRWNTEHIFDAPATPVNVRLDNGLLV